MTAVAPLATWDAEMFRERLDGLIDVYLAAMRYPPEIAHARAALWAEHSRRDGFACVVAETVGAPGRFAGDASGSRTATTAPPASGGTRRCAAA